MFSNDEKVITLTNRDIEFICDYSFTKGKVPLM